MSKQPRLGNLDLPVTSSALAPALLERGTDRPETQAYELARVQVEPMRFIRIPVRRVPTRCFPSALDLNRERSTYGCEYPRGGNIPRDVVDDEDEDEDDCDNDDYA